MNLAQSVAIFCYELGKGLRPKHEAADPAPHHLLQHLNEHTRKVMHEIGYFGDKNPERICSELLALAGRAALTTREASLLLALVRQLDARIHST